MSRHLMGEKIEGLPEPAIDGAASPATSGSEPSAAFTPGPWEVWEFGPPRVVNRQIGWTIYTIDDPAPHEEATHWANARLIAAAPELYEALKRARAEIAELEALGGQRPITNSAVALMDAALARSEGR